VIREFGKDIFRRHFAYSCLGNKRDGNRGQTNEVHASNPFGKHN